MTIFCFITRFFIFISLDVKFSGNGNIIKPFRNFFVELVKRPELFLFCLDKNGVHFEVQSPVHAAPGYIHAAPGYIHAAPGNREQWEPWRRGPEGGDENHINKIFFL